MGEFLQDVRVGFRQLVRRPAFAITRPGRPRGPDLVPALKDILDAGGHGRRVTLRDALAVGQLALVLLVSGALLARGFAAGDEMPIVVQHSRRSMGSARDLLAVARGFFLASMVYGYLALRSGSTLPGLVLHFAGDPAFAYFAPSAAIRRCYSQTRESDVGATGQLLTAQRRVTSRGSTSSSAGWPSSRT